MLHLVGANPEELRLEFSLHLHLPGTDISVLILPRCNKKHCEYDYQNNSIYFDTEDNPTSGSNQYINCRKYTSVIQPSAVESVLFLHQCRLWKLTHCHT